MASYIFGDDMHIARCEKDIPPYLEASVVTIGVFDGVHKGHQAILDTTVSYARTKGYHSVVLTFDPHPRIVHTPDVLLHLVSTLDDRLDRLAVAGIDMAYVQEYSLDYAQASPRDFIVQQVVGMLKAKVIVVGEDVRFGKNNEGNAQYLCELGEELGIEIVLIPDLSDESTGRRWSSTWLRELLAKGDVEHARNILGRAHRIRGEVVHGFQRGRMMGFPTANLMGESLGEVPADGVYAGWLIRHSDEHALVYLPAAISIGTNPQFGNDERSVEAHVLGRSDLNLYGENVAVEFIERIRSMKKFGSVDELLAQMDEDIRQTAKILGVPSAGRINPEDVTAQ